MESYRILKISMSNAMINLLKIAIRNILDRLVEGYLRTFRLLICSWHLLLEFVVGVCCWKF